MVSFFILNIGGLALFIGLVLGAGLILSVAVAVRHIYRYRGIKFLGEWFFWSESRSLEVVREEISIHRASLAAADVIDSSELERIKDKPNYKSLIYDRLLTIINLQKSYARIDLDILQIATETKESASKTLDIPGYFVGFAMLVGLFGTIIGLSGMIGEMQETLSALPQQPNLESWQQNALKVQAVLKSMQSAFSATLAGLFCSIVSSLFNYLMHGYQAQFYKELDDFTVKELLPLVYSSREASDLLRDANENIEKTFSKLQNIGMELTGNTQKLNAVHQSFNSIITNLERITQNPLRSEFHEVIKQLTKIITETEKANKHVQSTVKHLPEAIKVMEKNSEKSLSALTQFLRENQKPDLSSDQISVPKSSVDWVPHSSHLNTSAVKIQPSTTISGIFSGSPAMTISVFALGGILLLFIMWFFSN